MSASEMAAKVVPDTLMIVSYVSQYHEVFKNETPGNVRGIREFKKPAIAAATKTLLQNRTLRCVKCFAIFPCWLRCTK